MQKNHIQLSIHSLTNFLNHLINTGIILSAEETAVNKINKILLQYSGRD